MKRITLLHSARLGALAALFSMAACSVAANGDNAPPPAAAAPAAAAEAPAKKAGGPAGRAESQALWQKIQAEVGNAACDASAQCKTMPVGHKACGGPEGYLAYSTKSSDAGKLAQLGTDYAAARKAETEASGMVSNCMMVQDPGAACVANRCVLQKGGAGVSAQ